MDRLPPVPFPPVRDLLHLIERISIVPLVAGSIFQLMTGLLEPRAGTPEVFSFTVTHFWNAGLVIGALMVHIGVELR